MTNVTMKRGALEPSAHALKQVMNLPGQKFSYAVTKNLKKVEEELAGNYKIKTTLAEKYPTGDLTEYEKERQAMCLEFCTKDENGKPVVENNQYIPLDRDQWNAEYAKLEVKYPEITTALQNRIKEEGEYLDSDVTIEIHTIKEEDVSQYINGHQRMSLDFMIEEEATKTGLKSVK